MSAGPREIPLTLKPNNRHDLIDVQARLTEEHGEVLAGRRRALYCSHHTTAGFVEKSLSARLSHRADRLSHFLGAFRELFPPEGDYRHDRMCLRAELTEEEKEVEPRNADSHLTFIGAGLRNCVTYPTTPKRPVYFIDLDGVNEGTARVRRATVTAYDHEQVVHRETVLVPVSKHPIDSVNLADPRLGLLEKVADLSAREGLGHGRVDLDLAGPETSAGLTVNEYETMLMKHDLAEVLKDPLKFAAQRGRHLLADPRAIPTKTLDYAKYDFVQVLNSLMEAFGVDESVVEKLLARLMALPARRFLAMKRRVSFPLSAGEGARPRVVRGRYQSPILVQWGAAEARTRRVEVSLVRFR
jgi:thiamine phosphate synthase YjbQ (UPF0047 family)